MPYEVRVASLIMVPLFLAVMCGAVAFDCKCSFSAKEIGYVVTELVLASELEPKKLTISQKLP